MIRYFCNARQPVYQTGSEENVYSTHTVASQRLIQFTVCQRRKDHCHRKDFGKLEYFNVPTNGELCQSKPEEKFLPDSTLAVGLNLTGLRYQMLAV